jgi:ferric-dicitrate binding protein FerR (iron transport regulator)
MAQRPHDEAQRELERHALRNVRGLVDKMESLEESDKRTQRRLVAWVLAGVLAVAAVVGYAIWKTGEKYGNKPVVIDPAKLPPLKGGPQ